ncbi:hypothetical protein HYW39_01695 [Candidatus Curtissbacteria bacterium]|nr:hypothetical protein [Candidatus Curtissbacteria bacterium]
MPIIKRDFVPNVFQDPISKEIESTFQPKVTIFLKINDILYPFKIDAYVDSGAVRNLFPADPLKYFKIKLDNGRKRIHYGIGDKEVISFTHDVQILIGEFRINTEIDFSDEHKPHLLGTDKFFKFFDRVTFNMKNKSLELAY